MNSKPSPRARRRLPRQHHHSAHDAVHQPWEYGKGAVFWGDDKLPLAANLMPAAAEMHAWLTRRAHAISAPSLFRSAELEAQRNPYTAGLATLAASFAMVVNDAVAFAGSTEEIDSAEAEVRRIRLEGELVLYAARFCEAAIKQMLHCTNVPPRLYKNASMGGLLEQDCRACRVAKIPTHTFSLFGSLAHQYFLCHEIDACALDHLILANQRRNLEVAHATVPTLQNFDPTQSRLQLKQRLDKVGGDFVHLLSHILKIEAAMIREIELRIRYYPQMPPRNAYNSFLTRTATDYDSEGTYRGHGYRREQIRQLKEEAAQAAAMDRGSAN